MTDHLESPKGIKAIALVGVVGMGGAGKTTLARYYGQLKKEASIVWELNAETKESLLSSFENLAYTLTKTEDQRKELTFIENIQKSDEKEKQLLNFIKNLLKQSPNWIMIYDNVESFDDIKNYFPHDVETWGEGSVIVTTRNRNIQHSGFIKVENVINVEELSAEESLTLLSKILYQKPFHLFTQKTQEEMKEFLKNIPPFPLDVSVAAHYMKNNYINFSEYLKRIKYYSKNFEEAQKTLLKEMSDYTKTRYGIINLAFEKIIKENSNFKDLLLISCMLDSQNIPRVLLEKHANYMIVDQFIKNLRKHGLITHELTKDGEHLFSLHRSTQALGLSFLMSNLQKPSSQDIEKIVNVFNEYIDNIIEQEQLYKINPLAIHIETFLTHKDTLNSQNLGIIRDKLGYISYYYLRKYDIAKKILEVQLKEVIEHNDQKRMPLIKVTLASIYFELGDIPNQRLMAEDLSLQHSLYFQKNTLLVARLLTHLGYVYSYIGENFKSKECLEQSLYIYEKTLSKKPPSMARTLTYLGNTYRKLGLYQDAQKAFNDSLQLYEEFFPHGHVDLPWVFLYLGISYKELGNFDESIRYLKQSLEMYQKYLPSNHQDIALPLLNIGIVYLEKEDYKEAKIALENAYKIYTSYFSKDHINMVYVASYLGELYRLTKEYEKAQNILENSAQIYIKNFGENSSRIWRILYHLGCLYIDQHKFEKAELNLNKSLTILKEHQHPLTYKCIESLGDLYIAKSQDATKEQKFNESTMYKEKALAYFKESLKLAYSVLPKDSPYIKNILVKIHNN